VRYARSQNVTKIVSESPPMRAGAISLARSFLDEIVRSSGDIDVYVISGDEAAAPRQERAGAYGESTPGPYAASGAAVLVATGSPGVSSGKGSSPTSSWSTCSESSSSPCASATAPRWRGSPERAACRLLLSSRRYFSFAISDLQHGVTFIVMLVVAFVVSNLTQRIRLQADAARVSRTANREPLRDESRARGDALRRAPRGRWQSLTCS
jgi:two-component system sensor histidine kinase KdpD